MRQLKLLLPARYLLHCSLLLLSAVWTYGQDTDRFIDVRKIIKGALDVMRTYPAPSNLIQPLAQQPATPGVVSPVQPAMAIPLPMASPPDYRPMTNYAANMPFPTQQYTNKIYQPMQAIPPQYSQTSSSMRRIFAQPTKTDIDKLFHLPADIVQRLATDAGYIDKESRGDLESDTYRKYGQEGAGESSANNFNFNINQGATNMWGINPKRAQDTTTTTKAPAIVASGKPRILMRSVNREGKIIQIPVVAIAQPNGEIAYIPFERLSDLSDALAKLISTGQISMDDIFASSSKGAEGEKATQKSKVVAGTSNLVPSNPLIDQTGEAIATNIVPTQTMRKIFPVKDVVYPRSSSVQTGSETSKNEEHIMVEPPTRPLAEEASSTEPMTTTTRTVEEPSTSEEPVKEKSKKIVMTESKAFVQEMDAEDSQEQSKEKRNGKNRGSGEPTETATSPANDEIMLNGKRYKLVEPAAEDPTTITKSATAEMNSISSLISRMLKSQPTLVPPNGQPIPMTSPQMLPFNSLPATTTAPPFRVSQQQEYPTLPQQNEFKFDNLPSLTNNLPSPVNHGVNLVRKGISTVKTGDDTVKYGMNAVRHGMNLAGNSQPMLQQSYQKDAFAQQQETANAAARALAAQRYIYPVFPSGQLEPFSSGRSREVVAQPEEQAFLVNNGPSRPIPLGGIQSVPKGFGGDTRRKEEIYEEVDKSLTQMPFRRQYSLKELESFYNSQKRKPNTDNLKASDSGETKSSASNTQRVYPPLKQLKIGRMTSTESLHESKMARLEKLRRQFAQERAAVARRTKNMFLHRATANKEKPTGKVTELHCQNIRSFARQFGTLDVEFFAKNNCRFIETYHPDLKCSKVNEYLAECQKYF